MLCRRWATGKAIPEQTLPDSKHLGALRVLGIYPCTAVCVTARTFQDSTGSVWEVFEVQRSSQKAQAVSAGLEQGWLAFACGAHRRRLAPFPKEWRSADDAELARLCGLARKARDAAIGANDPPHAAADEPGSEPRSRVPRIRRAPGTPDDAAATLPIVDAATSADSVETTVRTFAHQARSGGLPAIEAMVRLKALLTRVYNDETTPGWDLRAVRRWFVESYYFERATTLPATPDQSL